MNQQRSSFRKVRLVLLVFLAAGLLFAATGLAMAGSPPLEPGDFSEAADQGFGQRANGWAWSMQWWNGYLYVGTNHNWHCAEVLAQARNSFGIITYPPDDVDIDCPADELAIDMRAEIWRWDPNTDIWAQVYVAPTQVFTEYTRIGGTIINPITETITIPPTDIAIDIGYRGMAVFEEPDGTEALYVTAVSPSYVGYKTPPRVLRSTDGLNFTALPQDPGTVLGNIRKTSIRNPTVHVGSDGVRRLYIQSGSSKGSGSLFEAADPAGGNDNFRKVQPEDGQGDYYKVSSAISWEGYLYLGIRDTQTGFKVIKMDATGGALPYPYEIVIDEGGYASYAAADVLNVEILSMQIYDCYLYVGGNGITIGTIPGLNDPAELFRIQKDGNWELVVGEPRVGTPIGDIDPLSGWPAGFGNNYNGHMWRMEVHNGHLYVTTFDGSITEKDNNPPPPILQVMGFDMFETGDGVNFSPVTIDGFSDQINDPNPPRPDLNLGAFDSGGRTMASTSSGLFLGTANYWYGLRIWNAPEPAYPMEVTIDGPAIAIVGQPTDYTAYVNPPTVTVPITYTWDATDQPTIVHANAGISDTVTYIWDTTGIKYITVRPENANTRECACIMIEVLPAEPTPTPTNTPPAPTPTNTPPAPTPTNTPQPGPTVTPTPTEPATGVGLSSFDGGNGGGSVSPWLALGLLLLPGAAWVINQRRRQQPR